MIRKLSALAGALALTLLLAPAAHAQLSNAAVVDSCGTATYPSGSTRALTQDPTGKQCTSATGGGGGPITAAANSFATGFSPDFGTIVSPATGSLLDLETRLLSAAQSALAACSASPCTTQIGNVSLTDGTTNTTKATVKAASTAAATTDTSVVVMLSPTPSPVCTSSIAISQTASTDLVTSVAKLNICSIVLISATAQSISLVEGTGSVCATGIAALIGGTSASLSLAANGGFSAVADRTWLKSKTTADHICLLQSGAGNVSGVITYADAS